MNRAKQYKPEDCPEKPHRGPQGPNEDLSQCRLCWSLSHAKRPVGEEWGGHTQDCSLPQSHSSFCQGGGRGHPLPQKMRGRVS